MNSIFLKPIVAGFAMVAFAVIGTSSAQDNPTEIVKERQQLMKSMGKSFGPIIPVIKGESDDLDAAEAAAKSMHDSIMKVAELFPAGTAVNEVEGSRAKPEVWTQSDDFTKAVDDLIKATADFSDAFSTGDKEAIGTAFKPLGRACGACHRGPADEGGKFRTPKT